ncbi:masticatory superfast myosin light chain 2, partial [Ramicandelaber brevisporus]
MSFFQSSSTQARSAGSGGSSGNSGSTNSGSVFAAFDQSRIQELKEAFDLFDQDGDGIISIEDLRGIYTSLGQPRIADHHLRAMVGEADGPINFTMFLTMVSRKLQGADRMEELVAAFETFDEDGIGHVDSKELRRALTTTGNRMTEEEV